MYKDAPLPPVPLRRRGGRGGGGGEREPKAREEGEDVGVDAEAVPCWFVFCVVFWGYWSIEGYRVYIHICLYMFVPAARRASGAMKCSTKTHTMKRPRSPVGMCVYMYIYECRLMYDGTCVYI